MQGHPYQAAQQPNWEYRYARDYNSFEGIVYAFPFLASINTHLDLSRESNCKGIVIRSANDDNVHKAIKYGIWTTTPKNRQKLYKIYLQNQQQSTNTYLFFSVVKSGMFEGVARLASCYHDQTFPFWWENHTLKFKGYFQIEWLFLKDINYKHFEGYYNMDGEEIIKSKDCDFVDSNTTVRLLQLFQEKVAKRWIFNDFAFMDEREVNYVRKMYEVAQERHHGQKMGEYQAGEETGRVEGRKEGGMAAVGTMGTMGTMGTVGMTAIDGNSMGLNMSMQMMYSLNNLSLNGYPPNPLNPMCQLPNTITRPFGDPQTLPSLGFQKNPISKNKKK